MKKLSFPQRTRRFLPKNFKVTVWSKLKPYYLELHQRPLSKVEDLENWILDRSELEAIIEDDFAWRYIRLSQNTMDERTSEAYKYAMEELSPKIDVYHHLLDEKLFNSPYQKELNLQKYALYLSQVKNKLKLFRKENVASLAELEVKSKDYSKIFSGIQVKLKGNRMPLGQVSVLLGSPDRHLREKVFRKMVKKVIKRKEELNELFESLLTQRQTIAERAGFHNYRDYKFQELNRREYTVEDCMAFHQAVATEVMPVIESLDEFRMKKLNLEGLRPWDFNVDLFSDLPLTPFQDKEELVQKAILCLSKIHPFFGQCMSQMDTMGHLDLDARIGKKQGGFYIPLYFLGVPYIFMNAAGTIADVQMIMNQSGHAVFEFLRSRSGLIPSKKAPTELTELAAMSMELLSMRYWNVFFEDKYSLLQAKLWQLERILRSLPWIAAIDKFQHWIYTHPGHGEAERITVWRNIHQEFNSKHIDFESLDDFVDYRWFWQVHLFESPFSYIGFGIAQLGAIALWKKYLTEPVQTIENYISAIQETTALSVPEVYEKAGVQFDFSQSYIHSLIKMVQTEWELSINRLQV